ncbi:hypothetical protein E1B28_004023 [Marasmius oreades]|uniref:DUF1014-domain-containing protein n=1 Tax=Marasmius oreades TaxID=181124 RepID=A0A9P7UXQ6_9AGAR|nr:uncharacterized protein E1B28_004023 [Marasmius oreades]KAG7096606.1 hypothetical protein E1B28_004023 [Marasmius oreades]
MAPKGGNAKKEAGRAKKAENETKKAEVAASVKERKEALTWEDGAKTAKTKDTKEEKRKADLARKAENARLLAEEESSAPSKVKSAPKAGSTAKKSKVPQAPAGPGAIAAGGGLGATKEDDRDDAKIESYAATGIDNALDLLEVVNAKADKASIGTQAAGIERHPERRFKAALEAYHEREMPKLKVDHPGLRLQQYKDLLYKQFQKSPDNPFNQSQVAYNASKEEKVEVLKQKQSEVKDRLRDH